MSQTINYLLARHRTLIVAPTTSIFEYGLLKQYFPTFSLKDKHVADVFGTGIATPTPTSAFVHDLITPGTIADMCLVSSLGQKPFFLGVSVALQVLFSNPELISEVILENRSVHVLFSSRSLENFILNACLVEGIPKIFFEPCPMPPYYAPLEVYELPTATKPRTHLFVLAQKIELKT